MKSEDLSNMELSIVNQMKLEFEAVSENEALARVVISAFISGLDITVDELEDVKTAVSEAVTNAIIHGYGECKCEGKVVMSAVLKRESSTKILLSVEICDTGVGIEDVEQAMQPMFTTGSENERSGMGFSFMEAFMDKVIVTSSPNMGTVVHMEKRLKAYGNRH